MGSLVRVRDNSGPTNKKGQLAIYSDVTYGNTGKLIMQFVADRYPNAHLIYVTAGSNGKHAQGSYHYGRTYGGSSAAAIDFGANAGGNGPVRMRDLAKWLDTKFRGQSVELIHSTPFSSDSGFYDKNCKRCSGCYSAALKRAHRDHVHFATSVKLLSQMKSKLGGDNPLAEGEDTEFVDWLEEHPELQSLLDEVPEDWFDEDSEGLVNGRPKAEVNPDQLGAAAADSRGAWSRRGHTTISGSYTKVAGRPLDGTLDTTEGKAVNGGIRAIQEALGVTVDGILGDHTFAAIKAFQKSKKLAQDGAAGPSTCTKLFKPLIAAAAKAHSVPADLLFGIISLESSFDPGCLGPNGFDTGLCQINLDAHRDVSRDQAVSPRFSLEWSAKRLQAAWDKYDGKGAELQRACTIAQHNSPVSADSWYRNGKPATQKSEDYVQLVEDRAKSYRLA